MQARGSVAQRGLLKINYIQSEFKTGQREVVRGTVARVVMKREETGWGVAETREHTKNHADHFRRAKAWERIEVAPNVIARSDVEHPVDIQSRLVGGGFKQGERIMTDTAGLTND